MVRVEGIAVYHDTFIKVVVDQVEVESLVG